MVQKSQAVQGEKGQEHKVKLKRTQGLTCKNTCSKRSSNIRSKRSREHKSKKARSQGQKRQVTQGQTGKNTRSNWSKKMIKKILKATKVQWSEKKAT